MRLNLINLLREFLINIFFAFDLTAVAGKTLAISFIPATLAFSTSLFEDKELILSNDFVL